jgi:hypothetical protein
MVCDESENEGRCGSSAPALVPVYASLRPYGVSESCRLPMIRL